MRIWDMELLAQKSDPQPVTDGLLYWIDGRDGIITPASGNSKLINRVDGSQLEITKPNASSNSLYATVGSDGFMKIDGASGENYAVPIQPSVPAERTSELVMKRSYASTFMYMLGTGWTNASDAQIYQNSMVRLGSRQISSISSTYGSFIHLTCTTSGNTKTYRINGSVIATNTGTTSAADYLTRFDYTGGIYVGSFRVYNRALSADEIQQNYNYEKSLGRVRTE